MDMAKVSSCNMTACTYNMQNICQTLGINVGPHAECNTFNYTAMKGGLKGVKGGVGACRASECKFNEMMECKAPEVNVAFHDQHPDCKTFQLKR